MKHNILFLFLALIVCSCWNADLDKQGTIPGDAFDSDGVHVFDPAGGDEPFVFSYTSTGILSFSEIPSFVSVEVDGNATSAGMSFKRGRHKVKLSVVEPNLSTSQDTLVGAVVFSDSGSGETSFFVTKQPRVKFSVSIDDAEYSSQEYSKNFEWYSKMDDDYSIPVNLNVQSNVAWEIVCDSQDESWISFKDVPFGRHRQDTSIDVLPLSYNTTGAERGCEYKIQVKTGTGKVIPQLTHTLAFNQDGVLFVPDKESLEFEAYQPAERSITINTSLQDWRIGAHDDWMEVMRDDSLIVVNVNRANPSKSRADGVLNFDIFVEEIQKDIHLLSYNVSQAPFVLNLDPSSFSFENSGSSSKRINVSTYGQWELKKLPDWLTCPEKGDDYFVLKPKGQNLDPADYSGGISIQSREVPVSSDITISQARFILDASVDKTDLGVTETGKNNLRVECSGEWRAELADSRQDWLVLSSTAVQGPDVKTIQYYAKDGNGYQNDRSATIVVKSVVHERSGKQFENKKFVVTQEAMRFDVDASGSYSFEAYDPEKKSFSVSSNVDWTCTANDSWINVQKNNTSVNIAPTTNTGSAQRKGTVTVSSAKVGGRTESKQITVTQDGYVFTVSGTSFALKGERSTVSSKVNCSGRWTVNGLPDWIQTSGISFTKSANLDFQVSAYGLLEKSPRNRSANVKIYCSDTKAEKVITFTQSPYTLYVTPAGQTTVSFDKNGNLSSGQKAEFSVSTNGKWDVKVSSSDFKVTKSAASFKVTASKNSSKTERKATVTVYNVELGEVALKYQIQLIQASK